MQKIHSFPSWSSLPPLLAVLALLNLAGSALAGDVTQAWALGAAAAAAAAFLLHHSRHAPVVASRLELSASPADPDPAVILQRAAAAANIRAFFPEADTALFEMLNMLGGTLEADSLSVFENHSHTRTGEPAFSERHVWMKNESVPHPADPALSELPFVTGGLGHWLQALNNDQVLLRRSKELTPAEKIFSGQGNQTDLIVVPVHSAGVLWGFALLQRPAGLVWSRSQNLLAQIFSSQIGALLQESKFRRQITHERVEADRAFGLYAEALKRAGDMASIAEQAYLAKQEFLANTSHEIRTPMNAILGLTQLLMDTELTSLQRDYLRKISNAGESLLGLINDILDLSKMEAGRMTLEKIDYDLHDIVTSSTELFAEKAAEKKLELICRITPAVPVMVKGDPGRLRQVLVNLIGNAVKFTPSGSITVIVDILTAHEDEAKIRFSVADTGIGIPKEKHAIVFESFTQADTSTNRRFGGSGLGLAITQGLVDLMGGHISLESREHEGSTFSFVLTFPLPPQQPRSAPGLPRGRTVLAAVPHPANLQVLRENLQAWGVAIREARTMVEALTEVHRAGESPLDAVLLDTELAAEDSGGATALWTLLSQSALPVIVLTTATRTSPFVPLEAGRIAQTLNKPIRISLIRDALRMVWAPSESSPDTSAAAGDRPAKANTPLGKRILLAEDNLVNRELVVAILGKQGYDVVEAENGEEALAFLEHEAFDVVLMDVQMPGMDGFEATRSIRQRESAVGGHVPIIAMTAYASNEDRDRCISAGMDGYLTKPLDREELFKQLNHWSQITPVPKPAASPEQRTYGQTEVPVIDWAAALNRAEGDRRLLLTLLSAFAQQAQGMLEEIRAALSLADWSRLRKIAHTLKGAAANLSCERLRTHANALEHMVKTSPSRSAAEVILKKLAEEREQLLHYIFYISAD